MRAVFPDDIEGLQGRSANSPIVYFMRGGVGYWRYHVEAVDPRTADQLRHREHFRAAARFWSEGLSVTQRENWQEWAVRNTKAANRPSQRNKAGFLAYRGAQQLRQAMGAGLATDAPEASIPMPVTGLQGLPSQPGDADTTFRFRVVHEQAVLEGYFLQVKTTPAMPTIKRRPREREYRLACGALPESFLPLQISGADYVLQNVHAGVQTGKRYGLRVVIVSAEGIAGHSMKETVIRAES